MIATKTARELRHPQSRSEGEAVEAELEAILKDPHFANSKRYPAFLRYVVEQTLQGSAAYIKERTIGVEVFGRSADYDTNNDTVVRYTAGEVRKRLAIYYHEHDDSAVQISIPQGSYVPDFLYRIDEEKPASPPAADAMHLPARGAEPPASQALLATTPAKVNGGLSTRTVLLAAVLVVILVAVLGAVAVIGFRYATRGPATDALGQFWRPVLHENGTPLLVSGAVVFSPNLYSGTETAVRTDEYPFVSMQNAAALARVSGLLQQKGGSYQMQPANATTLSDLRDRAIVLIGGYNNEWTLRLVQNTRFRLGPVGSPSILDGSHPGRLWKRDHSLPYAAADDYALIGRFHDATTGSLIVVVAGLGRNGTEAAAQFLTDPHYMTLLEQRLGRPVGDGNVEAVLKISVIDGKTGAPSLQDVTVW